MSESRTELRSNLRTLATVTIVLLIVLIAFASSTWWLFENIPFSPERHTFESTALFGDSFGAINALFSALAFAGVIIALILQAGEFRLAWEERKDVLEAQAKIARQQEFSSLVTGINTWESLRGHRALDNSHMWTSADLRYMNLRYVNSVLLDVALERIQREPVKGEKVTDLSQSKPVRDARDRGDFAAALANIANGQRRFLLDQLTDLPPETRGSIVGAAGSFRRNIEYLLEKTRFKTAKESQTEIARCVSNLQLICGELEKCLQKALDNDELTDSVVKHHISSAAERILREAEKLFEPLAKDVIFDEPTPN